MAMMTDGEIRAALLDDACGLKLEPLDAALAQIQPISVDMRLGRTFIAMDNGQKTVDTVLKLQGGSVTPAELMERIVVDPRKDQTSELWHGITIPEGESITIPPGGFMLGEVQEWLELPDNIAAKVDGRSSYGRLGITIHVTAGVVEPGFKGRITLEITNSGMRPVKLYVGERICQLVLYKTAVPVEKPYSAEIGSKYQNQEGATPSRVHMDHLRDTSTEDSDGQ